MTGQVTALVRQIIDRVYPVFVILDFAAEVDPNTVIGCGTVWERITDGRALIASDAAHPVGWTGGAAEVALTIEQMPEHSHPIAYTEDGNPLTAGTGNTTFPYLNMPLTTKLTTFTEVLAYYGMEGLPKGGNQPHNNMQPSLAVCRWKRVA